jgi:hypothetical protein
MSLAINVELKEALLAEARERGIALSEPIRRVLEKHVEQ